MECKFNIFLLFFQGSSNGVRVIIDELRQCPEHNVTKVKFNVTLNNKNPSYTTLDMDLLLPFDIGEHQKLSAVIETKVGGKWIKIFSFEEKNPCIMLRRYMGEFWETFQKLAKIPVNVCPLPQVSLLPVIP